MKAAIFAVAVITSAFCSLAFADGNSIRAEGERSGVCTLHNRRLIHATAFDIVVPPNTIVDLDNDQAKLWNKYPNAMYPLYRRQRDSDHPRPKSVTYCPVCQKGFEREW